MTKQDIQLAIQKYLRGNYPEGCDFSGKNEAVKLSDIQIILSSDYKGQGMYLFSGICQARYPMNGMDYMECLSDISGKANVREDKDQMPVITSVESLSIRKR